LDPGLKFPSYVQDHTVMFILVAPAGWVALAILTAGVSVLAAWSVAVLAFVLLAYGGERS